jgi:hypothetical protein
MSETLIANLALGRLGIGQAITSLSEQSNPARLCNRFYDHCRQELLRAFPWGFALRSEALAEVADQDFPGWAHVYQYPDDCLRIHAIGDESGLRYARTSTFCRELDSWPQVMRFPFQQALKNDNASRVLLSDIDAAYAFFTANVDNTGVFPPDFTSALADRLAIEIGGPLQGKAELIDRAEARYLRSLSVAAATAMNEQRDDVVAESPSISCRY